MFTKEERDQVRNRLIDLARSDPRVVSGALTGSSGRGAEDEWSDIDIAFGITEGVSVEAVLGDWTEVLTQEQGILHYWDLPFRSSLYRVFLLPSGLEIDIAAVPQQEFGPRGPSFRTLFGTARPQEADPPPSSRFLIGLGWHHALHARSYMERGKSWGAEHWISALRDHTLELACLRLGEETAHARGAHRLPKDVTEPLAESLVRSLDYPELRRALGAATAAYITELEAWDPDLAASLKPLLPSAAPQQLQADIRNK